MEFDKAPVTFSTTCVDKNSGSILMERDFEAISRDEAETRALLNCVKAGNKLDDVMVNAKKRIYQ
jgi:hypothetical protein